MIFFRARWVVGRRRSASLIPSGCRLTPIHKADVRNLQVAVYQTFNRNQSYGFHNSENA